MALRRHGGIEISRVPLLPIPSLQRIIATRTSELRGLNPTEFKMYCLDAFNCLDMSRFHQMAGLLLFVWPTEAAKCRRWHVRNALALNLFIESDDDELVDVVRLIWKTGVLTQALKHDLTLNALYRLGKNANHLWYLLNEEHAGDAWIRARLPASVIDAQAPPSNRLKRIEELTLECWYLAGERPVPLETTCKSWRYVIRYTRQCKTCDYRTMDRRLFKRPISKEPRKHGMGGHWVPSSQRAVKR
jgi:hypothetical protein